MTRTMLGKICMVTGATSGIGAATALALAQQGAILVVVGRNKKKCIYRGLIKLKVLFTTPQLITIQDNCTIGFGTLIY